MQIESLFIQFITISLCVLYVKGQGISCYRCVPKYSGYDLSEQLCSEFDGSKKFQVFCPSSQVCRKSTFYYQTQTSVIKVEERDCPNQKHVFRSYNSEDKTWNDSEEILKEVYKEGCYTGENRGAIATPSEYCFCSYHLCNSSLSNNVNNVIIVSLLTLSSLFGNLYFC